MLPYTRIDVPYAQNATSASNSTRSPSSYHYVRSHTRFQVLIYCTMSKRLTPDEGFSDSECGSDDEVTAIALATPKHHLHPRASSLPLSKTPLNHPIESPMSSMFNQCTRRHHVSVIHALSLRQWDLGYPHKWRQQKHQLWLRPQPKLISANIGMRERLNQPAHSSRLWVGSRQVRSFDIPAAYCPETSAKIMSTKMQQSCRLQWVCLTKRLGPGVMRDRLRFGRGVQMGTRRCCKVCELSRRPYLEAR